MKAESAVAWVNMQMSSTRREAASAGLNHASAAGRITAFSESDRRLVRVMWKNHVANT